MSEQVGVSIKKDKGEVREKVREQLSKSVTRWTLNSFCPLGHTTRSQDSTERSCNKIIDLVLDPHTYTLSSQILCVPVELQFSINFVRPNN